MRICSVEGCGRRFSAKDLCLPHYRLAWKAANRGRLTERYRAYYQANSAKIVERVRRWRKANPARYAKQLARKKKRGAAERARWRAANIDLARAHARAWAEKNRARIRDNARAAREQLGAQYIRNLLLQGGWPKDTPIPERVLRMKKQLLLAKRAMKEQHQPRRQ